MTENPDIIQSKIIGKQWDALWQLNNHNELSQKKVLVISQHYSAGSTEEIQLQKMLQACNLTTDDYQVVLLEENEMIAWHLLREKCAPKVIITLGITPMQLGISAMFHLHSINSFNDCYFIPAVSAGQMEKQPEAKKQLWLNALKPLFIDKVKGDI